MSANIKASTDGTQAIIGVGGVDQMTVSNAGVVTANSFVGAISNTNVTATGSTTARTLANRFADVVNVLDFGADPTGAIDATPAFALAMYSPKSIIIVPEGTYNLLSNVYVSDPKTWICSPKARFITPSYPSPGFRPSAIWYGRVIQNAPGGPICIANQENPTQAGEAVGIRLTNSQFVSGTPGTNDRVLVSATVDNVDAPGSSVWAGNFVANQIPGEPETRMIGLEIEVSRDKGDNTDASSNPWQGFVSTAIQVTGMSSSATGGKTTCALSTWAGDTTGQKWFQNGIAISRTTKWGLLFKQNPDDWNGITDTGTFLGGKTTDGSCVRVEGNATSIISSIGSHNHVFDFSQSPSPGIGVFCKMPTYGNVVALFRNYADYNNHISVSSGDVSTAQSGIIFEDKNTSKWHVQKLSDNRFNIYGVLNNVSPVLITEGGETQIGGNLVPQVDNSVSCGKSGNRWSAIWAANGTIQTSDEREKTEIQDSELGLDFITSLRPVSYKFKVGGNIVSEKDENGLPIKIEQRAGERQHFGLIAQEVKSAIPNGVDFGGWILTDKNNPDSEQGLRYEEFISPLIKAIQELSDKVKALENK